MKQKILIIGGDGYIGSRLCENMNEKYDLTIVDLCLYPSNDKNIKKIECDFNLLEKEFINKFSHVILLAGHSSVRMCDLYPDSVFNNNVTNFINLLHKLSDEQTLIYASSASVYGNSQKELIDESTIFGPPYNMYDLTKQFIDQYLITSNINKRVFGLRLGTVNGYSPTLRNDVMINAMVYNFWKNNKILLYGENTKRSILGTNDLSRAIECLINTNKSNSDIYNLSSFTKTAGEIAHTVADNLKSPLEHLQINSDNKVIGNEKLYTSKYNFSISSKKFAEEFSFNFTDTIDTIVQDLVKNKEKMIMSDRNISYNYRG